jgi:hypothetical protein
MSSSDLPSDPCVTAARALAFAGDERLAGRTVTIASAVRHVLRHGYPPQVSAAASFAAPGSSAQPEEYTAETILAAANALQRTNSSLSQMEAVRQVAAAVLYAGEERSTTVAFGEPVDRMTRGRLWLEASHFCQSQPSLDFMDALRRVAAAAGYVVRDQMIIVKGAAATASFASPHDGATRRADQDAYHRAAVQLQRLCPRLHYDECLRCVRG